MDIYQRLDIEGTVQVDTWIYIKDWILKGVYRLILGYISKIGYRRDCTGVDIWIYIKDWILKGTDFDIWIYIKDWILKGTDFDIWIYIKDWILKGL